MEQYTPFAQVKDPNVNAELMRISQVLTLMGERIFDIAYEEPVRPREGMLRYADGTEWDPGSGKGLYIYSAGAWNAITLVGGGGGGICYPQTTEEADAGVTPSDCTYPPGNVFRYAASGDGIADDAAEINEALSVDQAVYFPNPTGSYYVAGGITTTFGANKLVGDGIETRIKSDGANHTLTVASGDNDLLIDSLWVDQTKGSGAWDAIHLLGTETRIRHVDVDDAPRYGIYIGAYRTQIHHVQMQAVLDTGIYVLSTAGLNNIADVNFVIAGPKIPGKCIDVQSDFNTIANVIADQCIGYVLNLDGNYNVASGITARQPGGATANDFVRIGGNGNTLAAATCDNTTGIGYLVSGGANTLRGCVSTDSSGIGASITGSNNTFEGRIFNAGNGAGTVHGISVSGSRNKIDALVKTSSGDDLNISGDFNTVHGEYEGTVTLTSTSEGNNLSIRCGDISVNASCFENRISATCTADSGTIADIASNGNSLDIRVNEGGTIGCRISGHKNIGSVSSFGSSDTCIEVDGNYNALQVYASGATGEEMRVGGNQNVIYGTIEGDIIIDGNNNTIEAAISGNVTLNGDGNKILGYVGGSVTDNGSNNTQWVNADIVQVNLFDYSVEHATGTVVANAVTLAYATSQSWFVDLEPATGAVTITLSGGPPSGKYGEMIVRVQQDTTASRTITWAGGTFWWAGGTVPTMTATADAIDVFRFHTIDGGSTWIGQVVQDVQ